VRQDPVLFWLSPEDRRLDTRRHLKRLLVPAVSWETGSRLTRTTFLRWVQTRRFTSRSAVSFTTSHQFGKHSLPLPLRRLTTVLTPPMLTTVTVNITGHGCLTGDYVTISGVTGDPGGVPDAEINTEHVVTRVDKTTLRLKSQRLLHPLRPTAAAQPLLLSAKSIPAFLQITAGYGWGTGAWNGTYGWGLASPTPVYLPQRDWWFDNFDNDLVMNIRADTTTAGVAVGGPIYYWERGTTVNPTTALNTRAVLFQAFMGATDVPETAMQILVSQNDKHLLAFGCQPYNGASGDFDPLLIRWASQDDPVMWEPLLLTRLDLSGFPVDLGLFVRLQHGRRFLYLQIPTCLRFSSWARPMCSGCRNTPTTSPSWAHGQPYLPTTSPTGWGSISSICTTVGSKRYPAPCGSMCLKTSTLHSPIKLFVGLTRALMRSGGSTQAETQTG
jgi:hypothetical protein